MRRPTGDECDAVSKIDENGHVRYAAWHPQWGGYTAPCLIEFFGPGCFDVFVWHDGEFGYDDGTTPPRRLHYCNAQQLIDFGTLVQKLQAPG